MKWLGRRVAGVVLALAAGCAGVADGELAKTSSPPDAGVPSNDAGDVPADDPAVSPPDAGDAGADTQPAPEPEPEPEPEPCYVPEAGTCEEAPVAPGLETPAGGWPENGMQGASPPPPPAELPFTFDQAPECVESPGFPALTSACAIRSLGADGALLWEERYDAGRLVLVRLGDGRVVRTASWANPGWAWPREPGRTPPGLDSAHRPIPPSFGLDPSLETDLSCDGRPLRQRFACASEPEVRFWYDAQGLLSVRRSAYGNEHRFGYDSAGRVRAYVFDGGMWGGSALLINSAGFALRSSFSNGETVQSHTFDLDENNQVRGIYSDGTYSRSVTRIERSATGGAAKWFASEELDRVTGARVVRKTATRWMPTCAGAPHRVDVDLDGDGAVDETWSWAVRADGSVRQEHRAPGGALEGVYEFQFACAP